jgi:hypothetical protein
MGVTPVFIHLPLGFFSIKIAIHFGARGPAQVVMEKWVDVRSKKARSSSKQKLVAEKTGEQFLFC